MISSFSKKGKPSLTHLIFGTRTCANMCTTRCRMPLWFVVLLMLHRKAWLIRIASNWLYKGSVLWLCFLELNQFFTQHVGLGIVGFRWYSFSQMDVCWSLRCIHYCDKPDFVSFLPSRQGNFLVNPMFWGIQWKQNHLYFGGAFGFNEHICIFAFWWMLSTLMYVGCVSLFLLSM